MSDETKPNQLSTTEDETVHPLDVVADLLSDPILPAPIRKGAFKAFGQLCTALIDVPLGGLRRREAEKWAETKARVKIVGKSADQIAGQMKVPPEYARRAENKYAEKIIREQINLDRTSAIAANQLKKEKFDGSGEKSIDSGEEKIISDDFLNGLEVEARQKSTEEMQVLFGRILAGEIKTPGSFSIKTVKLLGELDQGIAVLFKKLCSVCIVMEIPTGGSVIDARVPSLGGNAGSNALAKYGLSFGELNMLNEYGLVISDYNSWRDYNFSIVNEKKQVSLPFRHQGRYWALLPLSDWTKSEEFRVSGVALSQAGGELFPIVDLDPMQIYTKDLKEFFGRQHLEMLEVRSY